MDPGVETRCARRFELLRTLGHGGMGVVYEAHDRDRDMRVALKMLREVSPSRIARLKREFRTLAAVEHPNIVALFDLLADPTELYFTMELVRGTDLRAHVSHAGFAAADAGTSVAPGTSAEPTAPTSAVGGGPIATRSGDALPPLPTTRHAYSDRVDGARLERAYVQLVMAVAALHERGIVHCDLKPSNVLVEPEGRLVVLDFGIATPIRRDDGERGNHAWQAGTPTYMAPEQCRGHVEPASDWYSVGVMLYEALTGTTPFCGGAELVQAAKQTQVPHRVDELVEGAPPALGALCASLLALDPASRPNTAAILSALGARARTPRRTIDAAFVGRAAELAELDAARRAASGGAPAAAVITGPSGMGKSTLAHYFLDRLGPHRAHALRGRCHEREQLPFNAFDAVLDDIAAHFESCDAEQRTRLSPPNLHMLARLFPVLAPWAPAPAAGEPSTDEIRASAAAALRAVLAALAAERPMIVLIDDFQWADRDSQALLLDLVEAPAAPPVLWLLTVRDEHLTDESALSQTLDELRRRASTTTLAVPPLSTDEQHELAVVMAGGRRRARTSRLDWLPESGGNPMLIAELVRFSANETGALPARGLCSIDDVLRLRVGALDERDRRLLELVAVAGQPTAVSTLATALAIDGADAARSVRRLGIERLVRTAESGAEPRVVSYHDRVRESIASTLSDDALAGCHLALANSLTAVAGARPDRVGRHFLAAGEPALARPYLVRAANRARHQLAFDRAAELYELILNACAPSDSERAELFTRLAACCANSGRTRDAAAAYHAAAALASDDDRLDLDRQAAEQLLTGGYVTEGLAATRGVLAGVGLRMPATSAGALPGLLWHQLRMAVRRPRVAEPVEPPSALAVRRADVCWSVGSGLVMVDSMRGALFMFHAVRRSLALGDLERAGRACFAAGGVLTALGMYRVANVMIDISEAAARAAPAPLSMVYGLLGALSRTYTPQCRWREVVTGCEQVRRLWAEAGRERGWEIDSVDQFIVWSRMYLGDLGTMDRRVRELVSGARRTGNRYLELGLRARMVLGNLMRDDSDTALADSVDATAAWLPDSSAFQMQHYLGFVGQCEALAYAGRHEPSPWLARTWGPMRRFPMQLARVEGVHARCKLALLEARERRGWSRRVLLARIGRWARLVRRRPPVIARPFSDLVLAGIAHLRGDADGERARLEAAIAALDELDTSLYAAAARRRLGQVLGGDEGAAMVAHADADMRARGVVAPARMASMLVPPWDET